MVYDFGTCPTLFQFNVVVRTFDDVIVLNATSSYKPGAVSNHKSGHLPLIASLVQVGYR